MDFTVAQFVNVAKNASWFHNDIVMDQADGHLKTQFFHSKSTKGSESAKTNWNTSQAFHQALVREYGIFGAEAFKLAIGDRVKHRRSLRKEDVLDVVKMAQNFQGKMKNGTIALAESKLATMVYKKEPFASFSTAIKDQLFRATKAQVAEGLKDPPTLGRFTQQVQRGYEKSLDTWLQEIAEKAFERILDEAEATKKAD